ncbi:probable protein phosphatase CG10417 [Malaya genurostris]|uniref:probable protein phosphatase CG10417 n=1 Tax=Malaya genurostris TaxID=325434 RepID=UPI0026F3A0C9|nr:probable protein phosphatase CG10417 [Malaya genurostris]
MGAYLSEPLTTKDSSDEANDVLGAGSSSMQGWRISQEDAHNCILNFDENTSFFAVYDGHGGAEVAQYCSLHLPTFLKSLSSYKSKDFEKALKDAFIGFDATLLEDKIIEELKKLSDKTNGEEAVEDDEEEEDEDDNVDDLCKEACMPLNEVLQMYKKEKKNPALNKIKEGNCSKPLSPFLKGKRKGLMSDEVTDDAGPSSSNADTSSIEQSSAEADVTSDKNTSIPDAADSTVSSSSNKSDETLQKPESSSTSDEKIAEQSDEISDTNSIMPVKAAKEECAPDSSSSSKPDGDTESKVENLNSSTLSVNGDVESGSKSTVSSSSATNQENGVVSSNTNAGSSVSCGAGSSSSASKSSPAATNGPNMMEDDSEEDDSDTDEEFPPVADVNETSSTEDGEEDPYCEEASEEDEEDNDLEYTEDDEDYMNEADEAFMNNITDEPGKDSGCTAVVALLHEKELFVANAGDSRCVVCRDGKALEMSFDHKPEDQIEFDRIQKAGGRVTLDGRVNGGLNLSRAIGDHGYKMNKKLPPEEQMISALPDIKQITIGSGDDFMVLACDGIWNFMTSDDVVEFVQERIRDPTKKLSEICEEMFDYCLAPHTKGDGTGCDNMTAIIVQFKPNFIGGASRKRAASTESETTAANTDCKKAKTEAGASSTTGSNGSSCETTTTSCIDEKEAAAAVASIETSSLMDSSDNTASSST